MLTLRDKTVLGFDPSKVSTIAIKPSDKPEFAIQRAGGDKWNVVADGKTSPADIAIVERFMDQIHDLKGNSIIMDPIKSPEMFGMDKPALIVTLLDKDGKEVGQLRLVEDQCEEGAEHGTLGTARAGDHAEPSTTQPRARAARYFPPTISSSAS